MATAILPVMTSVWRFALSLSGQRDLADDLTQATVLRAMESHGQYRDGSNLTAWCITICRSIWLNQMRAQAIRKSQSLALTPDVEDLSSTDRAETNYFAREVIQKVLELPEAQRETVVLVYVEGFKYTEAAQILDVPLGTIMSRLSTARAALKHLGDLKPNLNAVGGR